MEGEKSSLKTKTRRSGWLALAAVAVVLALAYAWMRAHSAPVMQKRTRFLMDTICTVYIPGDLKVLPVIDRALDRAEQIDKKFNCLNSASPIYAFNTRNVPISDPEVVGVVKTALEVSRASGGALDITVYPLVKLWGFFSKTQAPRVPAEAEIKDALRHIGYQYLQIKEGKVYKTRPDIEMDLGAVAKGYAVGEALKVVQQAGIRSALIDFGGDIYALGRIRNREWKVGIRNPRGEGVIGTFDLSDLTTSTSGDYERYFEVNGIRYHHILDPKTGYPARGVISLTVIAADATLADAWSTALFVLGKEKSLAVAEKLPLAGIVLVTPDGKISYSSALEKNLVVRKGK